MISVLSVFRLAVILLTSVCTYLVLRQFLHRSLEGTRLIAVGAAVFISSLIVGILPDLTFVTQEHAGTIHTVLRAFELFALPAGVLLLVVGIFRLSDSLQPHLDSSLVEHSFVGVFVIQEGVIKHVNSRFAEIAGCVQSEIIGRPLLDFIAASYKVLLQEKLSRHEAGEREYHRFEAILCRKDGEEVDVEIITSRMTYNRKPAIQGTLIDNRTRRQALNVILAGEERFRTLANNSHDIISEHNAEGGFTYLSSNIKKILGYESYELINTNIFNYIHSSELEKVREELGRCFEERTSARVTFRFKNKECDWQWFESTGRPYVTGSGDLQLILVSRDITNQRKIQEEILKASKLESIGVLAGGIAHNFNNILTVILGNVSLAKSYFDSDEHEPIQILEEAENACLNAQDLTAQFLTFAKGGEPVKQPASLARLVRSTINLALRGSQVKCEYSLPRNLHKVQIDKGQINQVIHNMVINSDHAMPQGGKIKVSASNCELNGEHNLPLRSGSYVLLRFEDEGCGISEEHLSKVFDPYFTTKKKGNGLGLATAYSIIKNHDGLLTVESKIGTGTTFFVYLPADNVDAALSVRRKRTRLNGNLTISNGKVLIMDDEETIRKSVSRMLLRLGYEVESAKDGGEAIRLYESAVQAHQPFDAVLMDLTIPGGMGGREAIERLRKLDPEIRAIVSSGYSNDPIMSDYKRHGFTNVIAKPYRFDRLGKVINEVILNGH